MVGGLLSAEALLLSSVELLLSSEDKDELLFTIDMASDLCTSDIIILNTEYSQLTGFFGLNA